MELQNSKDWAKVYRACNFIEKGVCEYANERVYVSQEALQKSLMTMKGRPVIIDHKTGITPENMQEYAVGYVTGVELNNFEAGCDCQFVIFDDKGKEVIADGYSVSCAYKPIAFGPGGTWHNVPYDREIVELEFTHLALVQNPRYEDAKVYENAKEEKGRWITVKGTHVFIKEGQSVEDAIDKKFKGSEGHEAKRTSKIHQDIHDRYEALREETERQKKALEGKYAKEDADFDVKQLKKDIDEAQSFGYEEIEDIAEFLGLDEDEVRETLSPTEKKESNKQHKLQVKIDDLKSQENEIMKKYWEADEDGRDELQYKLDAIKDERLRLEDQVEKKTKTSFDEEGFKKFVEANKKKSQKDNLRGKYEREDVDFDILQMKKDIAEVKKMGYKRIEEIAEFLGLDEDEVRETIRYKEKHNSKEDTMNVEEFFNKMGEIIEEKFNACKGKMNEADEEEKENEDDDKFEMDGEVYSKKELVNAFKEKKNAEDEEEKEEKDEEEEKQNSNDEFFNAMEQRMLQYNKEEGDKVQVYTQQKGLERGKAIYGK